jgi:hypothetical protein
VILPNLVFQLFIQQSIPQLRKSQNRKPLVVPHFFGTGLQSQNFREFDILFSLRKGQLWTPISRLLLGFCSAYIYSFERFFSQLFNNGLEICQFSSFFVIDENVGKRVNKYRFSKFLGPALKKSTYLQAGNTLKVMKFLLWAL